MAEQQDNAETSRSRPVLLAILLTSLAWLVAGGAAILLWRLPKPVAFQVQPPPATATPLPSPTPAPVAVDVAGAVRRPGVYRLPAGARVADAIAAAGGMSDDADVGSLSLARAVQDGEKLDVPAASAAATVRLAEPITTTRSTSIGVGNTDAPLIDINAASLQELETLPGIGPKTAQAIIDYRAANGPFVSIEDLDQVKGIGEGTLAKIRALITVQ